MIHLQGFGRAAYAIQPVNYIIVSDTSMDVAKTVSLPRLLEVEVQNANQTSGYSH